MINIKRAKEELKNAIEAYLWKDAYGNYEIPVIRQRPILLIGPPGVGKTQIMEQVARECKIALGSLYDHPSHPAERRGSSED